MSGLENYQILSAIGELHKNEHDDFATFIGYVITKSQHVFSIHVDYEDFPKNLRRGRRYCVFSTCWGWSAGWEDGTLFDGCTVRKVNKTVKLKKKLLRLMLQGEKYDYPFKREVV